MNRPAELIESFKKLSTPCVSDALDRLRIRGGCHGVSPIVLGKRMVGPAFTVKYVPTGETTGTVGDYIDDVQPGEVVVLDNNGRTDCTVWGDILTFLAAKKGLAGTVIDGVCRDVDGIRALGYPMFSRGHYMVTGKDRVMVQSVGEVVSISSIQVRRGDLMMGDETGVLVIPRERAAEVLAVAVEIEAAESHILAALEAGSSIREARGKFRYNELQRAK